MNRHFYQDIAPLIINEVPINLVTIKMDHLLMSEKFLEVGGPKALETFKRLTNLVEASLRRVLSWLRI